MKKAIYLLVISTTFTVATAFSQEAFSLVDMNKMVLNPAFTGMDTAFKHNASLYARTYSNSGVTGLTNNSAIGTYQMRLDKINSGIGIMVNDNYMSTSNFETINQTAAKVYYRYTLFSELSIGIDAGFVNQNTNLHEGDYVYNAGGFYYFSYPPSIVNTLDFDGGIGLLYQIKYFYAGFSMDHLTNPKASYPNYDEYGSVEGYSSYPMQNYQGIAYNWIIGGSIPIGKCGIDLSAAYYQMFTLNMNATFQAPHFFLGFSAIQTDNNENLVFSSNDYYYYVLMGGIKAYHNKIKVSFAYNFFPNAQPTAFSLHILEGGISYSF